MARSARPLLCAFVAALAAAVLMASAIGLYQNGRTFDPPAAPLLRIVR